MSCKHFLTLFETFLKNHDKDMGVLVQESQVVHVPYTWCFTTKQRAQRTFYLCSVIDISAMIDSWYATWLIFLVPRQLIGSLFSVQLSGRLCLHIPGPVLYHRLRSQHSTGTVPVCRPIHTVPDCIVWHIQEDKQGKQLLHKQCVLNLKFFLVI